ncbi:23S rRNA (adenine(2030)-N(6))-methyltransferase RlmJ [Methylicorpusculum sp.]|uniref:23S rRNA (adenine(2030)-N(6))-methyltransferase RlmJ n=1 Tax=Methylicorpusculum sp. TaxID=2713644 RepID=UPI00272487E3|nr:23S rRNA (adenine(2030)-N(6))-methyltransferase RlmJ [Methylicorpusculum sp.]MDO8845708.1 23S rRNA (adenine(2030)-N(6))-methyltransferase RlmJ [Methylicorpusculum sp.]
MLSYRHGFHAGNFADVLKHSLISLAITSLNQKDKPYVYIDTHAGAGRYLLKSAYAEKTGEYLRGIARIWQLKDVPPVLSSYLGVIKSLNMGKSLIHYPGSPALVKKLIRHQDRMQLSELHSSDFPLLLDLFKGDKQVTVNKEDGPNSLIKKLPPIQKRGLILIDPSYELKEDYRLVVETLVAALNRFATGIYGLWYPVIDRGITENLMKKLIATGIRRQLRIEFCPEPDSSRPGMTGCGMLFINPPWQLESQARELLLLLNKHLANDEGCWKVDWQVPE